MSRRRQPTTETSREYGRIPLSVFLELWGRPDTLRFRYRAIRIVPALMLVTLAALWGYYLYSALGGAPFTLPLGLFGGVLLLFSGWLAVRLIVWRLFVRRSAVALTKDVLAWRHGPLCFLVPWDLVEPEGLGLEGLALNKSYDSFLTVKVGDTAEPLFLVRLYARLDDVEGFMGEVLKRIPIEKWERAKRTLEKERSS